MRPGSFLVRRVLRWAAMSDSDHRRIRLLAAVAVFVVGPAVSGSCLAMGEVPAPTVVAAAIRSMTLDEALRYAREHQPSLQGARARVAAAAADTRVARAQWLPSFGATLQAIEGTTNNSTASYITTREVALPRIGGTAIRSTGDLHAEHVDACGAWSRTGGLRLWTDRRAGGGRRHRLRSGTIPSWCGAAAHRAARQGCLFCRPRRPRRPARGGGRLRALAAPPRHGCGGSQERPARADRADTCRSGPDEVRRWAASAPLAV